ncbi:MAG: response regulator [Balneolaceae bacterium]
MSKIFSGSELIDNTTIEYRLFRVMLWVAVVVFGLWFSIAMIADYIPLIKLTYGSFFIIYSGLMIAFYKGVSQNLIAIIFYPLICLMVAYTWLPSGGLTGVILIMFLAAMVTGLLILPLRAFIGFTITCLLIIGVYMVVELLDPQSANFYTVRSDHIRVAGISALIAIGTMGIALYMFKKEYKMDRERLRATITQLEVEKEKAQAADTAKSEFLAVISHEMRTPLNGIVGISELLKETKLDSDQESLITNLNYSSEHLRSLISDILDVTLIESGKLIIQSNEIQIKNEIQKIIEIVKPRLEKKKGNIELTINHDSTIPKLVIGDSLRFRQVLLNLISNAIKFTNKGSINVISNLVHSNDNIVTVRFTINDTGSGISEIGKKQLFSKFYKGASDSNIEGTGLGLSISKNLVTLMDGSIGFESKENAGSSFYFQIPFKAYQSNKKTASQNKLKQKPLEDIKILIVEDVRINQIVIKKLIESLGLKSIDLAENGEIAVQKANTNRYDVILMDIQMPVMDGVDASKLISQNSDSSKKPIIIAVTANAMVTDQKKYELAGIDGYLTKPITKESLREELSRFI